MAWDNVLLEKDGEIAVLSVNRPKALNALNADTLKDLSEAVAVIAKDQEIKVVILTGAGDKAFVAGADIAFMANLSALEARAFSKLGQDVFAKIETLPQPVIAAVNGFALGGGCELAMSADIRIASEKAKFGQPEVGLGIMAGFAGTQRLPRLVGKGRAKELLYTADVIDANEAYRIGLANKVVPAEELIEAAKKMAKKVAAQSQVGVQLTKSAINEGMEMPVQQGYDHEADLFGLCFSASDQKEGMAAFIEKRKPQFTGK